MDDGIEKGIVKSCENGFATIIVGRTGSCDSCMINGLCMGKNKTIEHKIKTDLPLKAGDCVHLEIAPASRIMSSFVVFIFPILMMMVFFAISRYAFHLAEAMSIIISLVGLILSGVVIYWFDKKMGDKIRVEIIEKLEEA